MGTVQGAKQFAISMTWPQYKRCECTFKGRLYRLSPIQAEILFALLVSYPRAVKQSDLVEVIYEYGDHEPPGAGPYISRCMAQLRAKFGYDFSPWRHPWGYRLHQLPWGGNGPCRRG